MFRTTHIQVLTGGPYHPVARQFAAIQELLGAAVRIECRDGAAAFDELDGCDLFVAAGLHWTGMETPGHLWPDGVSPCEYRRPDARQKRAFADYVSSGRPVLAWHGGTGSFDDWPEFGALLGFRWVWGTTAHSAYDHWHVEIASSGHPVIAGAQDYDIDDELYYDVEIADRMEVAIHASAQYDGARRPMVATAVGGRAPGAGRTAFLANGHDLQALDVKPFRTIVANTIRWLVER